MTVGKKAEKEKYLQARLEFIRRNSIYGKMELEEQKCQCYTCIYAPNNECGWYAACNNCIDGSNYWRKSKEDGNENAT